MDWTAILSITGAFGAAATAQFISHRFSYRREYKNYHRERLQNLYFPLLFKVRNYIHAENYKVIYMDQQKKDENAFEQAHKEDMRNPRIQFEKIIEVLDENIKYADQGLIIQYEKVKAHISIYMQDGLGNSWFNLRVQMCEEFLKEYIYLSKALGVYTEETKQHIKGIMYYINLRRILLECYMPQIADCLLYNIELLEFMTTVSDLEKSMIIIKEIEHGRKRRNKIMDTNLKYSTHHSELRKFLVTEKQIERHQKKLHKYFNSIRKRDLYYLKEEILSEAYIYMHEVIPKYSKRAEYHSMNSKYTGEKEGEYVIKLVEMWKEALEQKRLDYETQEFETD
ncbi:hypothetical protein WQ54_12675 [Bacillus sp. SA1-12]|nr:hypothetical protein WQ54_12675 [Bacillus sp. SA1-12]